MIKDYWTESTCVNCGYKFRTLQKDTDKVTECPFCRIVPVGFKVTGTTKESFNPEQLKRTFIGYLLDHEFNPNIDVKSGEIRSIDVKSQHGTLICHLNFDKHDTIDQVLLESIGWVDTEKLKKVSLLYQEIAKLYKELENEN